MDDGFFLFFFVFLSVLSVSLLFLCCSIFVRFQRRFQRFIFCCSICFGTWSEAIPKVTWDSYAAGRIGR
jgi:hypothetical protein